MLTASESPWTGWHRSSPQASWRCVCEGESEAEVLAMLPAVDDQPGTTIALPSHRHPDRGELPGLPHPPHRNA